MARAGQLLVDIDARTARMEAELGKVERRLRAFGRVGTQAGRQLKSMERSFASASSAAALFGKALAFTGLTVGVAGLKALVDTSFRTADALAKTADVVGLTTEQLQELRFAADQSGVAQRQLDIAMQRFSRRAGEAAAGTGTLGKEFDKLGINAKRADGSIKSTRELLGEYANAISSATSRQEQLRLAFVGFDAEGAKVVNVLRDGAEGLDEFARAARAAGDVLEESTVRSSELLVSRIDALKRGIGTQLQQEIIKSAESVHVLLDAFEAGIPSEVLTTWVAPFQSAIADALTSISEFSEAGGETIGDRFGKVFAFLRRSLVTELPANLKAAIQIAVVEVQAFSESVTVRMESLRAGIALIATNIGITFSNAFGVALGAVQNFVQSSLDKVADLADRIARTFEGSRFLGDFAEGLSARADALRGFGDSIDFASERIAKVEAERAEAAAVYRDRIADIESGVAATAAALDGSRDAIFAERDATLASTEATIERAEAELETAAAIRARMLADEAAARARLDSGGTGEPDAPEEPTGRRSGSRTARTAKTAAERAAEAAEQRAEQVRATMEREAESIRLGLRDHEEIHDDYVERVNALYAEKLLSDDERQAAIARSGERLRGELDRNLTEMEELGKGAAQALESSFADFLFDPFEDGLSGMVDSFTQSLRRMAANAAAEGLANAIFGGGGGAGTGGGGLAGIASTVIGSIFRAGGGQAFAGRPVVVGERGPELLIPQSNSRVVPNHGLRELGSATTVNQTFNFSMQSGQPVDRRSATQVRAAALAGTQAALRKVQ